MRDWSSVVTKSHTNRRLLLAVLLETMNAGVNAVFGQRRDIQGGGFMSGNVMNRRSCQNSLTEGWMSWPNSEKWEEPGGLA